MKTGVLIKTGEGKTPFWPLFKSTVRLGRGVENDIVLAHPSVSREHAEIVQTPDGGWQIADRESRNGTRVNGIAVARRRLREGDLIALGEVTLRFSLMEMDEAEGAGSSVPSREPTGDPRPTLTLPGGRDPLSPAWPGLQGWQMIRTLLARGVRPPQEYAAMVLEDVSGWRDILGVGIGLQTRESGRWQWMWSPNAPVTLRRRAEEEAERWNVRETGPSYRAGGGSGPPSERPELVVLSFGAPEGDGGLLSIQGAYGFSPEQQAAFQTVAEALTAILAFSAGTERRVTVAPGHRIGGRDVEPLRVPAVVGRSPALQQALRLARKAAASDATVLIRGETGTGKEVFARLIAAESRRHRAPFVPVHCSAIDETLLGSTLFGHEKGAFTGAVGLKRGVFEEADGGTVFLDEIGELTPGMQVKLLRVLQEGEFLRLGGTRPLRVNVRVLAATHRDLEGMVKAGSFREDLYYRLNVISLPLPPLRDRREDLPDLIRHFLDELAKEMGRPPPEMAPAALARLEAYAWPGNIRELRNVLERAMVLSENGRISEDDLPPELSVAAASGAASRDTLAETERDHILRILRECGGNKRVAAQRLGISRSTLYERLRLWTAGGGENPPPAPGG